MFCLAILECLFETSRFVYGSILLEVSALRFLLFFFYDPLRSALARGSADTLRMCTLLRMLASGLASALFRYHPG